MSEMFAFDPVLLSNAENQFLLEQLGKPAIVALRELRPPVNAAAVRPILERVNELQTLQEHEGLSWCGVEPMKAAIREWFKQNSKWSADARRSKRAPRWPSMSSFDARGKAHRSGIGSDAGRVRTYFGPNGERIPFAVQLQTEAEDTWAAPGFTEQPVSKALHEDPEVCRIECRVPVEGGRTCGHTESYKEGSRKSYSAARARMSKHLRKATDNVDGHREAHTLEFTS